MQEVVGLRLTFYKKIVNKFTEFSESHLGKTPIEVSLNYDFLNFVKLVKLVKIFDINQNFGGN